jgi:hypothetical protein
VYNLRANHAVEIRDHAAVQAMRVHEVNDEAERARLWKLAVAAYPPYEEYQATTTRLIPVFPRSRRASDSCGIVIPLLRDVVFGIGCSFTRHGMDSYSHCSEREPGLLVSLLAIRDAEEPGSERTPRPWSVR